MRLIHNHTIRGAWLAQLVERGTLDLGVVSSNPTLGVEPALQRKKEKNENHTIKYSDMGLKNRVPVP